MKANFGKIIQNKIIYIFTAMLRFRYGIAVLLSINHSNLVFINANLVYCRFARDFLPTLPILVPG